MLKVTKNKGDYPFQAQNKVMTYLKEHDFNTPVPMKDSKGNRMSLQTLEKGKMTHANSFKS